jgi:hypothetical protein
VSKAFHVIKKKFDMIQAGLCMAAEVVCQGPGGD